MDQHVAVQLPLNGCQGFQITPWSYLVPVDQANFHVAYRDDLGLWERREVVELASDSMHLRLGTSQSLEPLLRLEH